MPEIDCPCWMCGAPAVWRVTAEKAGRPDVTLLFWACERCAPFEIDHEESANGACPAA